MVEGCVWVGLFHMLGCGGGGFPVDSCVLGLVAGLVGCSDCSGGCWGVHCCLSSSVSF